jgi:hypothetical protein
MDCRMMTGLTLGLLLVVAGLSGCTQSPEPGMTPRIDFWKQAGGWLVVNLTDPVGLNWSAINISLANGSYGDIHLYSDQEPYVFNLYNGSVCPAQWGGIVPGKKLWFMGIYDTITLTWLPTGLVLGSWIFARFLDSAWNSSDTPPIRFWQHTGMLFVNETPEGVNWSDINISCSSGHCYNISLVGEPFESWSYSYGNGSACPASWGQVKINESILMIFVNGSITLAWVPTGEQLGRWEFFS